MPFGSNVSGDAFARSLLARPRARQLRPISPHLPSARSRGVGTHLCVGERLEVLEVFHVLEEGIGQPVDAAETCYLHPRLRAHDTQGKLTSRATNCSGQSWWWSRHGDSRSRTLIASSPGGAEGSGVTGATAADESGAFLCADP